MLSFTEFLTEAKIPTFKSYVKETFDMLAKTPKLSVKKKLTFGHDAKKESASFALYTSLGHVKDKDKSNNDITQEHRNQYEKLKKTVLLVLGCTPAVANAKHTVDIDTDVSGYSEVQTITFTDTKNTYNVQVKSSLALSLGSVYVIFDVEIFGADIKSQTTFVEHPEFKPGAILHASWGYSMTINTYYEIVKRTNKTVYVVEIGKKKVDGDGWTGHEVAVPEQKGKTVYSGRIKPDKSVTIDKKYCRLWDGSSNYYNSLD